MPCLKDIPKVSNGVNLGDACWWRHSSERPCNLLQSMDDPVFCGGGRYSKESVRKLHRIQDNLALGVSVDEFEAGVGAQGGSNVESLLCVKVLRPLSDRFSMNEDPTTHRP